MASELAKKAAGTYVEDRPVSEHSVIKWFQTECREGKLAEAVRDFVQREDEFLDPSLVLVEAVDADHLVCSIPSRQFDHEADGTFPVEVRFTLDPSTGTTSRVSV